MRKPATCTKCGSQTLYPFRRDNEWYCLECYNFLYITCEYCGIEFNRFDGGAVEDHYYCQACYDRLFFCCDHCGEVNEREFGHFDGYLSICEECYESYYVYCEACGRLTEDFERINDAFYCYECADSLSITPYGQTKAQYFYGRDPSNRFYGIELEVECDDARYEIAKKLREKFDPFRKFFEIKEDGSLENGFEIATQPCTLIYHKKIFPWRAILSYLLENNCKSHRSPRCGLHIHVSRDSICEAVENKLFLFIVTNKDKIKILSRRSKFHYCRFNDEKAPPTINIKTKINSLKYVDRYSALNLNSRTIELRIFRGTLKYSSFIAALEFYDAMILFCSLYGIGIIASQRCWSAFKDFVKNRQYKYLHNYIIERGA